MSVRLGVMDLLRNVGYSTIVLVGMEQVPEAPCAERYLKPRVKGA